jgi:tetratricopeptide (TPR) repeat protein
MEQWDKGADAFRKGLLLNPADAECLDGLITVLLKMGRYDEVISEVEDAIAARPDEALHVPFLLGLAEALQSRGDWERAIATIRRAVDQAPDSKDARNQLAWALATAPDERWRDGAEGAEVARPLEADIENSIYLDTLAAVRAELGQWEQAIDFEERALAVARKEGRADRVADFENRLELYRQQKPYRSPTGEATP